MIRSTQIARLDGLYLCASVDDEAVSSQSPFFHPNAIVITACSDTTYA